MSEHQHVARVHGVVTLEDGSQHPFAVHDINADTSGRSWSVAVCRADDTATRQLVRDAVETIRYAVTRRQFVGHDGPTGPHLAREARCDAGPVPPPVAYRRALFGGDFDCCDNTSGDVHHVNHSAPAGPLRPATTADHTPDAS